MSNLPPLASAAAPPAASTSLGILDTPPESEFDELTRLAVSALGVESAAICLIDENRRWFKSRQSIPFVQTSRDIAFCNQAVGSREPLIVLDARLDPRFIDNPLVTREGGIRFYAGIPLIMNSGHCIGTLCVFDRVPRAALTQQQMTVLTDIANLATERIDCRQFRWTREMAAKVVHATSDATLAVNRAGTIVYWNPAAERMFGWSRDDAIGQSVEVLVPARLISDLRERFEQTALEQSAEVGKFVELVGLRNDGHEFPVELSLARYGEAHFEPGFVAIVRDVTERKDLEREWEHSKSFLANVVANLPAMLFVKDAETRQYLMVNRAGQTIMGRPESEIIGRTDRDLFPEYALGFEQRDTAATMSSGPHTFESKFTHHQGETAHLRTTRTLIDGPDRPNQYLLGISEDVTQVRLAQSEIVRLAHYDALTGLLNRASYYDRFHSLVQKGTAFALLSIDLDRFKAINDQFGHPMGDAVLSQVGDRLRSIIGGKDWVARIGGDEFIAVLVGKDLRVRAKSVAERIIGSIAVPFETERGVARAGASIGIVLMPDDGTTVERLRENVDLALYRAKHIGKAVACFFNADMDATARERRQIEQDLRRAVAADEIFLDYQPLLSVRTGRVVSAEALARWTQPMRGSIGPDFFIALAEECGLIDVLGDNLLRRACMDAQTWPGHVHVAVNLSPLQFMSDDLLSSVRRALAASGLEPQRLQLEVTEGLVIQDVERTFQQLEQLRMLGIQILIDDFGVGYSSLSYFQRFPFDKVKIDKSFVDEIESSRAARAIVQAVVGLGEQLEMAVVAEGVESEAQKEILVELGCTHLQGYLFSRPLSANLLREMLENEGPDDRTSSVAAA